MRLHTGFVALTESVACAFTRVDIGVRHNHFAQFFAHLSQRNVDGPAGHQATRIDLMSKENPAQVELGRDLGGLSGRASDGESDAFNF
jgi:hypothetical protein